MTHIKKIEVSEASDKDQARFWSKVERTNGCWWWRGGTAKGRGQFMLMGIPRQAHRVAYELTNGPIPSSQILKHTCEQLLCVNPAHLCITGSPAPQRAAKKTLPLLREPRLLPTPVAAAEAPRLSEVQEQRVDAARPVEDTRARPSPPAIETATSDVVPYAFGRELSGKTIHLGVGGRTLCGQAIPLEASHGHVSFLAHRDCQLCALGLHRRGLRCAGCGIRLTTITAQGLCPRCTMTNR